LTRAIPPPQRAGAVRQAVDVSNITPGGDGQPCTDRVRLVRPEWNRGRQPCPALSSVLTSVAQILLRLERHPGRGARPVEARRLLFPAPQRREFCGARAKYTRVHELTEWVLGPDRPGSDYFLLNCLIPGKFLREQDVASNGDRFAGTASATMQSARTSLVSGFRKSCDVVCG
jgi:hypothetical protein